jgi:hypothetical protein
MELIHLPLEESFVRSFSREWVAAWNAHDIERILDHYAADVVLTSPVARRLLEGDGRVRGVETLRAYFARGLAAYPNICFELVDVLWGLETIVLYYRNQLRDGKTAEVMLINGEGKVAHVWANYDQ